MTTTLGRAVGVTAPLRSALLAAIPRRSWQARPIEAGALRRVALLWAAGRAINLLVLWCWFEVSQAASWSFGPDGHRAGSFLNFLTGWDADRYGTIAGSGYPLVLPTDGAGTVLPNNWAFLPVFPLLTRLVSDATDLPWRFAAVGIALAGGLAATMVLYALLRQVASPEAAWWATVVFSVTPVSFLLVVGYSEGLFLALTFGALLLAIRRRYVWIIPVGIVASFTRPGSLALALVLMLVLVVRWLRREDDQFPLRERIVLATAALATTAAASSWPVIADAVTGVPHAYVRTETGWWIDYVGTAPFVPFTPWFRIAWANLGILGAVLVLVAVAVVVLVLRSRGARELGGVVWAYLVSYMLYLFAVFLPQQSLFRILLPVAPALAHPAVVGTVRRRRAVIAACIALQPVAVLLLWTITNP